MEVRILPLGGMDFPKHRLVRCQDPEEMLFSPAWAVLIRHPTLGNVLYDTGHSPAFLQGEMQRVLYDYPIRGIVPIQKALAQVGLTPGDIDQLILSHIHFDHAGGLAAFAGTQAFRHVLVAEADLKQAWWSVTTGQKGPYIRSLFDLPGIRFETIRDTTWLAEDLDLFVQQAHTPGALGMILKTQHHGTLLTTSDTLATAESYQHDLPPGTAAPAVEAAFHANRRRVQALAAEYQATLLFGHDAAQVQAWAGKGTID